MGVKAIAGAAGFVKRFGRLKKRVYHRYEKIKVAKGSQAIKYDKIRGTSRLEKYRVGLYTVLKLQGTPKNFETERKIAVRVQNREMAYKYGKRMAIHLYESKEY